MPFSVYKDVINLIACSFIERGPNQFMHIAVVELYALDRVLGVAEFTTITILLIISHQLSKLLD
jgi:hypothetical protein